MEQTAASLNWLCARWLERRHTRRTGRDGLHRESFIRTYHQTRNLAATRSRLRRYCQNEGAL
jgi:esterase/lipase superfamily enzyme